MLIGDSDGVDPVLGRQIDQPTVKASMPHRGGEASDGRGSAPVVQVERIMVPAQHRWPPKLRRAHSQAKRGDGLQGAGAEAQRPRIGWLSSGVEGYVPSTSPQ